MSVAHTGQKQLQKDNRSHKVLILKFLNKIDIHEY